MIKIFLKRRSINLSKMTVLKYMRELKIRSVVVPKKPRYHKGECFKKFDNLLKQDFQIGKPNKNEKKIEELDEHEKSCKNYDGSLVSPTEKNVVQEKKKDANGDRAGKGFWKPKKKKCSR